MGHNLNHFKSGTAEIFILSLAEFFLPWFLQCITFYRIICHMEKTLKKKLNNCLLSFNSKASSALYYEQDNASNIKWLEFF